MKSEIVELQAAIEDVDQHALQVHCWYLDDRLGSELAPFIKDRNVIDLGGGDGSLALVMARAMQARLVTVVEKEQLIRPHPEAIRHRNLAWYLGYLIEFCNRYPFQSWDVAVLAYPPNQMPFGVTAVPILDRCEYVVVLGKNDGITSCGPRQLWEYLTQRMLCRYLHHPRNDLLIYHNRLRPIDQHLVEHEKHGLTN